jgi:biopolymer transport protein ExbD
METQEINNIPSQIGMGLKRREPKQVSMKLTPLIDMVIILLTFLLMSASSEPEIMSIARDLQLPISSSQKTPKTTSIIAVTPSWILLDGAQIVSVNQVLNSNTLLIPELLAELRNLRGVSEKIGEMSDRFGFTGNISIQGDRTIEYQILKKVMYTCGQIGYNEMMLAVMKEQ